MKHRVWSTHIVGIIAATERSEAPVRTATCVDLENVMLGEELETKGHLLYDSPYMKYPE